MQQQNTEFYKWYIIHTHSGFEAKVINNIKEEIKKKGLSDHFEDFLVPTQKTLEIKKGKKVEGEKKFYPGYILIKMIMNEINLNIQILDNAKGEPEYGSIEASGLDLKAGIDNQIIIKRNEFFVVPTGIIIEIPKGYEAQVRPRSGLAAKNGISVLNTPGTIDSDYRGELKVILINHGKQDFSVTSGMRIAQLIIAPSYKVKMNFVKEISTNTKRCNQVFGYTGL